MPLTGTESEGTEPASVALRSLFLTETPGESGCRLLHVEFRGTRVRGMLYIPARPPNHTLPCTQATEQTDDRSRRRSSSVVADGWPMVEGAKMAQPFGCARAPKSSLATLSTQLTPYRGRITKRNRWPQPPPWEKRLLLCLLQVPGVLLRRARALVRHRVGGVPGWL